MKRSGPPARRTRLKARTPFVARKRIISKRVEPRRQNREMDSGENDWSAATRAEVRRRSSGVCEWPGCNWMADQMHHRKLRGFGDHRAVNCLHLCRAHHAWIHAHPFEAYLHGWLVRSTLDPASVKVEFGEPEMEA